MATQKRPSELARYDAAVAPQETASDITGNWLNMAGHSHVTFVMEVGAMAKAATCKLEVHQAKDRDGDDEEQMKESDGTTDLEVTVTSPTKVQAAKIALDTVVATNAVKVNGLTFTGDDTPTDADREFDTSGSDAAAATSLAAIINHADYGVPGVHAAASGDDVLLYPDGTDEETTITLSDDTANITISALKAVAMVDVPVGALKDGFGFVTAKVVNSAEMPFSVLAVRAPSRYSPKQNVAADVKRR